MNLQQILNSMKIKELAKPYMKWVNQGIEGAKHLYNELEANFPQIDTKLSYSSLDESIVVEKSIEGNIQKEIYLLKAAKDGKKFDCFFTRHVALPGMSGGQYLIVREKFVG